MTVSSKPSSAWIYTGQPSCKLGLPDPSTSNFIFVIVPAATFSTFLTRQITIVFSITSLSVELPLIKILSFTMLDFWTWFTSSLSNVVTVNFGLGKTESTNISTDSVFIWLALSVAVNVYVLRPFIGFSIVYVNSRTPSPSSSASKTNEPALPSELLYVRDSKYVSVTVPLITILFPDFAFE